MGTHFTEPKRPTARKTHQCVACYADIAVGETYVTQSGHFEDRAFRNKYHAECWDALIEYGDFEFTPGELDPPERLNSRPTAAFSGSGAADQQETR